MRITLAIVILFTLFPFSFSVAQILEYNDLKSAIRSTTIGVWLMIGGFVSIIMIPWMVEKL